MIGIFSFSLTSILFAQGSTLQGKRIYLTYMGTGKSWTLVALIARKMTILEKKVLNVLTGEVLCFLSVQQSLAQSAPSQIQVKNSLLYEAPDRKAKNSALLTSFTLQKRHKHDFEHYALPTLVTFFPPLSVLHRNVKMTEMPLT